jgi:DNA-binding CsgD family transcriptional regulator
MTLMVQGDHVRKLFRLFGEARELGADPIGVRAHLLDGICGLLGAQVAAMVEVDDFRPGGVGFIRAVVDRGWGTPGERATAFEPLAAQGSVADPALARMMHEPAAVVTRRRQDLVGDQAWYRSALVMDTRRPARIDHAIYSVCAGRRPGAVHGMCVNRPWGDRPFTEEESALVHLFHEECSFVYASLDPPVAPPPARALSRREKQTLEALLSGASEKQIAAKLGLSPHTVHQYVKAIYRAFTVQSRAELLARVLGERR